MRNVTALPAGLIVAVGLCASAGKAAEQPLTAFSPEVKGFIEGNHFMERISEEAKWLWDIGYAGNWSDALIGAIKINDEERLKIFTIPFIGIDGEVKASIIGGLFEINDDTTRRRHQFITTTTMDVKPAAATRPTDAAIANAAAMAGISIDPLIRFIAAGDRAAIFDFVLHGIEGHIPDVPFATAVKLAFESCRYSCPSPPLGFPYKSIWYVGTCVPAPRK